MLNRKAKERSRPLFRVKRNPATWEGLKARSLEEMSSSGESGDLSLIFDGAYLVGILIAMKWEMM